MDAMADFRMKYAAKHTRFPVDHVIRCFGWTMDSSFLGSSTKPDSWLSQPRIMGIIDGFKWISIDINRYDSP